jgi:hypothetical protein
MAFKMRVWWFAKKFNESDIQYMLHVCSNGVLRAIQDNDLRAYFVFKLKERAYEQALAYKRSGWNGNDWITYPEHNENAIDMSWELQYGGPMHGAVAGC